MSMGSTGNMVRTDGFCSRNEGFASKNRGKRG